MSNLKAMALLASFDRDQFVITKLWNMFSVGAAVLERFVIRCVTGVISLSEANVVKPVSASNFTTPCWKQKKKRLLLHYAMIAVGDSTSTLRCKKRDNGEPIGRSSSTEIDIHQWICNIPFLW